MTETSEERHLWWVGQQVWQPCVPKTTRAKTLSQRHLPCWKSATDRQKLWICRFHIRNRSRGDLWQYMQG